MNHGIVLRVVLALGLVGSGFAFAFLVLHRESPQPEKVFAPTTESGTGKDRGSGQTARIGSGQRGWRAGGTQREPPIVTATPPEAPEDDLDIDDPRAALFHALSVPKTDAESERKLAYEALQGSGRSNENWTQDAQTVVDNLVRSLRRSDAANIDFSRMECFRAGCIMFITSETLEAFSSIENDFTSPQSLVHTWRGGKMLIAPQLLESGRVTSALILVRPSDSEAED